MAVSLRGEKMCMTAPNIYRGSTDTDRINVHLSISGPTLCGTTIENTTFPPARMITRLAINGYSRLFQLWCISEQGQTKPIGPAVLSYCRVSNPKSRGRCRIQSSGIDRLFGLSGHGMIDILVIVVATGEKALACCLSYTSGLQQLPI